MPRSATRFSCRVRSPGTCTSPFYNSRLTYICFFSVFSPKSKRDPISQTIWCGTAARAKTFNMCHFWPTEPSSDPNWDNLFKFGRKFKLHEKSNQSKQLTQETGLILHLSIQREVDFYSPFLPSDWTILSRFFLFLHRKYSPRWDKGQTPDTTRSYTEPPHFQQDHVVITFRTLKGCLPQHTWSSPQETIVQTFRDNNDNLHLLNTIMPGQGTGHILLNPNYTEVVKPSLEYWNRAASSSLPDCSHWKRPLLFA